MIKLFLKKIIHVISFYTVRFFYKKLKVASIHYNSYLRQLVSDFRNLPVLPTDSPYGSINEWHANLNELRDQIINENAARFLQFNVVQRTMFIPYANYTKIELSYLKARDDWNSKWRSAIIESEVGVPTPYFLWPLSSSNLIHHAYHLARFADSVDLTPEKTRLVLEFGGGYGSMCRLFHELKFCGLYIIFDFPHFSKVQSFYLENLGYKKLKLEDIAPDARGFVCVNNSQELESVLYKFGNMYHESLFLATWSLSEAPLSVRISIEETIKKFKAALIAYQGVFNEVDNANYFQSIFNSEYYVNHIQKIEFLSGNYYCFSIRK